MTSPAVMMSTIQWFVIKKCVFFEQCKQQSHGCTGKHKSLRTPSIFKIISVKCAFYLIKVRQLVHNHNQLMAEKKRMEEYFDEVETESSQKNIEIDNLKDKLSKMKM